MADGHQPGTSGDRSEDVLTRVLDGLGAEPASAAAHAEAATDVDRIRRALHTIGAEAARAAPAPAPARVTRTGGSGARRWTRLRPVALGAAALIALLASVVGLTRLNGPADDDSSAGGSTGYHEFYLSCASTIVEGDILNTRPAARPGHIVLTLGDLDWLVPSTGPDQTEIEVPIPGPAGAPPLRTGQRQLLFVWRDADQVDRYSGDGVDTDIRKQAWRELLPRARDFSRSQCAKAGAR